MGDGRPVVPTATKQLVVAAVAFTLPVLLMCSRLAWPPSDVAAANHHVPHQPPLLIFVIAGINDASGRINDDAKRRCRRTQQLYEHATTKANNRAVRILTSGDVDRDGTAFNPTTTPHWTYVTRELITLGVPADVIINPGVPALHTVHEAIMAHKYVIEEYGRADDGGIGSGSIDGSAAGSSDAGLDVVVVVSAFHLDRVRHLFSVAFKDRILTRILPPGTLLFESVPNAADGQWLEERLRHEALALNALTTSPSGLWKEFISANNLEAENRINHTVGN